MSTVDRITSDPVILGGKPIVRGTRISVELILELIASGATRDDIVRKHPQLSVCDVEQALEYVVEDAHTGIESRTKQMITRDEIVQQALTLPAEDRAYVADLLEGSLPDDGLPDAEIAAAWTREIERRVQAYDRGETTAVDFDAAMQEVRQALEARRAVRAGRP